MNLIEAPKPVLLIEDAPTAVFSPELVAAVTTAPVDEEALRARVREMANDPDLQTAVATIAPCPEKQDHHHAMRRISSASYLKEALTPILRRRIIRGLCAKLKGLDFDTVVFRGMSGWLIGAAIADKLGKHMLYIRKPEEYEASHSSNSREGHRMLERYIIVDDLISSGNTIAAIVEGVEVLNATATCVCIALYCDYSKRTEFQLRLRPPCPAAEGYRSFVKAEQPIDYDKPEFRYFRVIGGHIDNSNGRFSMVKA